jgi:DNA-binding MarR family transcriptional regulator
VAGRQAGIAAEFLAALSAVRRTARRATRQTWSADPLPVAQGELLRLVMAQPGISVAEAAAELRLAPNTVSTLVGRLAARDLLTRHRGSADGRSVFLAVTGKARERIAGYRDLRADLTQDAMEHLAPEDARALAGAVPAMLRLAEQIASAERPVSAELSASAQKAARS